MHTRQTDWPDRITIDPEICNGKPTIRGLRITAQTILEFLGAGEKPEEILRQYPSLEMEDILACMSAAARVMDHQFVTKQPA
ncbi:MAG TPA: DUF433 domain-containing protein [Tepidisphaeraceae bacterium]|nr:DUF433 domain-containing protein [Tepidisphaeraceae bacterium]